MKKLLTALLLTLTTLPACAAPTRDYKLYTVYHNCVYWPVAVLTVLPHIPLFAVRYANDRLDHHLREKAGLAVTKSQVATPAATQKAQ